MRISHIYPVVFVIVVAILGISAYMHWNTAPGAAPSQDMYQVASSTPESASPAGAALAPAAPSSYTAAQVAEHSTAASCWTSINGSVYDVTTWVSQHPGGSARILSLCGNDGSSAFNGQHGGQARPADELASFKIGTLAQ